MTVFVGSNIIYKCEWVVISDYSSENYKISFSMCELLRLDVIYIFTVDE